MDPKSSKRVAFIAHTHAFELLCSYLTEYKNLVSEQILNLTFGNIGWTRSIHAC
jgi:methylglyoxal synthase